MKSVLLSIKPKYCELIANGKKTIEVRKNRPKLKTPFKCYIYCTKAKERFRHNHIVEYSDELYRLPNGEIKFGWSGELMIYQDYRKDNFLDGKVIGEFVCDEISSLRADNLVQTYFNNKQQTCLTDFELLRYANGQELFYWNISSLKIYDTPKDLSEFYTIHKQAVKECSLRERIYTNPDYTNGVYLNGTYLCKKTNDFCRGNCWKKSLTRPPQSWCYVEEL